MIECKICGKKFKQLNHRHLFEHDISTKEYKEKYNVKSLTSKEYNQNRKSTFLLKYSAKNNFGRQEVRDKIDPYEVIKKSQKIVQVMECLGYTLEDLEQYLKNNLPFGVTWEAYLESHRKWSIDHIIPINYYNIKEILDNYFKKCWNYRNLRIITFEENSSKCDKLDMSLIDQYNLHDLL